MKIAEIMRVIIDDLKATDKKSAIQEMVESLVKSGFIKSGNVDQVVTALMDREELGSTGIGRSVAVPHAKDDSVGELVGAFARSKKGVSFDSLDGEPVHVLFMLLSSRASSDLHLVALAYISRLVREDQFVRFLREAKTKQDILDIFTDSDARLSDS